MESGVRPEDAPWSPSHVSSPPCAAEAPSSRILPQCRQPSDAKSTGTVGMPRWWMCFPLLRRPRAPYAVGPSSPCWVDGENLTSCSICEVSFGTQHKHVTRRHCRMCGGVFCYTCTYDKAELRTWPQLSWKANATKSVHVCADCYTSCPTPADGLRRCRFCHQRVRRARSVPSHSASAFRSAARAGHTLHAHTEPSTQLGTRPTCRITSTSSLARAVRVCSVSCARSSCAWR